jgi:dolichyl-phosphate beta-glucosyltransferase
MFPFNAMLNDPAIRLSVIIPAYNEELRLPQTLAHAIEYLKAQQYSSEILVVNDGSTDRTEQTVYTQDPAPVSLKLLAHDDHANHGKGASVKKGMMEARGAFRLFMDADNSTTLDQVDRFWPFFEQGYDVVIGSRALKESVIGVRQARHKEIAGRFGNWFIRTLAIPGIQDTQAGFKVFSAKAAGLIFPRQTIQRWGYDIELLVIARLHGCLIREVPITWINASGSKVTMQSYFQVMGDVLQIRRNRKAGLYK